MTTQHHTGSGVLGSDHRNSRQSGLIAAEALERCCVVLIGTGAGGRQAALALASIGVSTLLLYDPDHIEVVNLGPQGWDQADVGRHKVDALADECRRKNDRLDVYPFPKRFTPRSMSDWPINRPVAVFMGVDSIEQRRRIWEAIRSRADFVADGRMNGEVIRILASDAPLRDHVYSRSLFEPGEAFTGSCTTRSTFYSAAIAANLTVGQFVRWLRGQRVVRDQFFDLRTPDHFVTVGPDPEPLPADRFPRSVQAEYSLPRL